MVSLDERIQLMSPGESIVIYTDDETPEDINSLRWAIKKRVLLPDSIVLATYVQEYALPLFMDGSFLYPRMMYVKQ